MRRSDRDWNSFASHHLPSLADDRLDSSELCLVRRAVRGSCRVVCADKPLEGAKNVPRAGGRHAGDEALTGAKREAPHD